MTLKCTCFTDAWLYFFAWTPSRQNERVLLISNPLSKTREQCTELLLWDVSSTQNKQNTTVAVVCFHS